MSDLELDQTAEASDRDKPADALTAGCQLGKYRLERVLGEGGMGVVWAAKDPDLQRSIAIKLIKHVGAPTQLRQRLLREAIAMAKLKHPNVLTVYEAGTVADRDYIAMELVEGTSMASWLTAGPPREEVFAAILAAGRGLAAAHEAGIVHRDFKPHNVLRSRDGRVLVTDFGLARASLDDDDAPAHAPAAEGSVLDEKLTQTGALLGTPAYMAPEQYAGAAPDPRTDQFAFCVTAWQALTGDRPFQGDTLEEMRRAVGGGVAHLHAKLPGPIRAVLARGLDPVPEKRWPSLEALLDALQLAARVPSRRRTLIARTVVLALAALLAFAIFARGSKPVPNACDNPQAAFAEAWSPPVRSALQRAIGASPGFDKVTVALDQFEDKWVASYQKACRSKSARTFAPRVQCLESVRDQVTGMTEMLKGAPPKAIAQLDTAGMLPQLTACDRAFPVAPPALPKDQPRRGKILALYGRMMSLTTPETEEQRTSILQSLETEATAVSYPPATATLVVMIADEYLREGWHDRARAEYVRALPLAKIAADHRLEARVHIGLLELEMHELTTPGAPRPAKLDDLHAQPVMHPVLANAFTAARSAANDDALLLGSIEMLAADAYMHLAQWNRYRSAYTDALAHVTEAHKLFQSLPDVRRDARASALEARIYLERGDERALDDAFFAARRAADQLAAAGEPTLAELDNIRGQVAFARRDYNEFHRIGDAYPRTPKVATTTISGRVEPPGRARIVTWRAGMTADPRRGYLPHAWETYDVVESAADGTFTIHAEDRAALLAESGDQRALAPAVDGVVLKLRPTTTQSGTVIGKNLMGVHAFAQYEVGYGNTWRLEVPVERDGTFDLRGMPSGATPQLGLSGPAGDGWRTVIPPNGSPLVWPSGQTLDIIVRGDHPGAVSASTSWRDEATASPHPVGASNTDAGREEYRPGDQHAVITGNATGPVEVCAGSLLCKTIDVRPTVEVDYPDGRYAAGVTPIVLGP